MPIDNAPVADGGEAVGRPGPPQPAAGVVHRAPAEGPPLARAGTIGGAEKLQTIDYGRDAITRLIE
jgi:hypothetical protein